MIDARADPFGLPLEEHVAEGKRLRCFGVRIDRIFLELWLFNDANGRDAEVDKFDLSVRIAVAIGPLVRNVEVLDSRLEGLDRKSVV